MVNRYKNSSLDCKRLTIRLFVIVGLCLATFSINAQSKSDESKRALDFDGTLNILIDDDRMLPATFTIIEGRYRLRVYNAFASMRLDLRLDDDKGSREKDDEIKDKAMRGEVIVDLKPGNHVLYVAQRPKWRCALVVTDKKGK